MTKLDRNLLNSVKRAFVPMPGGQAEPVAGAGQMTAGLAAPMGGGGDPAAMGGMPMDPAAMGGDPAAMGGDPAAMGGMPMDPGMMGGGSMITMTVPEFIQLIQVIRGDSVAAAPAGGEAPAEKKKPAGGGKADVSAKLDQILQAVQGGAGGGMPPPMDPAAMGGMPPPMDPAAMGGMPPPM